METLQTNFNDKENGLKNLIKDGCIESAVLSRFKGDGVYEVRIRGIEHYVKWEESRGCWVVENVSGNRWYPLDCFPGIRHIKE